MPGNRDWVLVPEPGTELAGLCERYDAVDAELDGLLRDDDGAVVLRDGKTVQAVPPAEGKRKVELEAELARLLSRIKELVSDPEGLLS